MPHDNPPKLESNAASNADSYALPSPARKARKRNFQCAVQWEKINIILKLDSVLDPCRLGIPVGQLSRQILSSQSTKGLARLGPSADWDHHRPSPMSKRGKRVHCQLFPPAAGEEKIENELFRRNGASTLPTLPARSSCFPCTQ